MEKTNRHTKEHQQKRKMKGKMQNPQPFVVSAFVQESFGAVALDIFGKSL
jgi:hypothetical protein